MAEALITEERWRQVLTSLVICLFARGVYDRETVLEALAIAGQEWTGSDLDRLGRDTLRRKYAFKEREGFDLASLRIPTRILTTPSPAGPFDDAFLREAIRHYGRMV